MTPNKYFLLQHWVLPVEARFILVHPPLAWWLRVSRDACSLLFFWADQSIRMTSHCDKSWQISIKTRGRVKSFWQLYYFSLSPSLGGIILPSGTSNSPSLNSVWVNKKKKKTRWLVKIYPDTTLFFVCLFLLLCELHHLRKILTSGSFFLNYENYWCLQTKWPKIYSDL